jgi:hypothetical protein
MEEGKRNLMNSSFLSIQCTFGCVEAKFGMYLICFTDRIVGEFCFTEMNVQSLPRNVAI